MPNLTPKQERFVQEYLVDLNATRAAIRAGYSARNAGKIGPELLGKTRIADAIRTGQKARAEATGITAAWALKRLQAEAEFEGEGSSHSARVSAVGLAMRHLGMLKEDAPHPDRPAVDLRHLTDDALDKLLSAVGPLLAPELRALGAPSG